MRCVRFFVLEEMPLSRYLEVAFLYGVRSGDFLQVSEHTFGLSTGTMRFTLAMEETLNMGHGEKEFKRSAAHSLSRQL